MGNGFAYIDYSDREIGSLPPNTLIIPMRIYIALRRPFMTKRGFRRWRTKVRKGLC